MREERERERDRERTVCVWVCVREKSYHLYTKITVVRLSVRAGPGRRKRSRLSRTSHARNP